MIRASLDALTQGGYAEGWAYDDAALAEPVALRLHGPDGAELGGGLANLYRADLADAGFRYGWCAFRLRLTLPEGGVEALKGARLVLREAAGGAEIVATAEWRLRVAADPPLDSVARVVARDPTTIADVQQLSGCDPLFRAFIARHGVAEFVRAASLYILGTPPAEARQASWERLLRAGALTPFGLLVLLAETEEAQREKRRLPSPADPGFVFAA